MNGSHAEHKTAREPVELPHQENRELSSGGQLKYLPESFAVMRTLGAGDTRIGNDVDELPVLGEAEAADRPLLNIEAMARRCLFFGGDANVADNLFGPVLHLTGMMFGHAGQSA